MSTVRRAAGFVLCRKADDGLRFLLLRNALHGSWGFPKGHVDGDEDDLTCARRELLEETGLDAVTVLDGFRQVHRYAVDGRRGRYDKEVVYLLARLESGRVELSEEHSEMIWADHDEAVATLEFEDLRQLIRDAAAFCKAP